MLPETAPAPSQNLRSQVPTHLSPCNSITCLTSQSPQSLPKTFPPSQKPKPLGPSWCRGGLAGAIVSLPKPLYNKPAPCMPPKAHIGQMPNEELSIYSHRDLLTRGPLKMDRVKQYCIIKALNLSTNNI